MLFPEKCGILLLVIRYINGIGFTIRFVNIAHFAERQVQIMKNYAAIALSTLLLASSLTACASKETPVQPAGVAVTENTNAGTVKNEAPETQPAVSDDAKINAVKNGTVSEHPDKTWEDAFESFFSEASWRFFRGTLESSDENGDGKPDETIPDTEVVEFTGHCTYADQDVLARIQFRQQDDGSFAPFSLAFNDVPQSRQMLDAITEKAFENAPAATTVRYDQVDALAPAKDKEKTTETLPATTAVSTLASTTAAPATAAPTQPPSTDPRIGQPFDRRVVVSDASAGIYLRPEPDLDASHLLLIPKNEIITVYNCKTPGWFYTTYDGTSGYVYAEYTKDPGTDTGGHSYVGYGRVDVSAASAGIYLRPYANLDAEWLTLIPKNEIIDLYSCDSPDWYYTYYNGMEGYVYADYIDFGNKNGGSSGNSGAEHTFLGYGTVTVSAASAGIYLRPYCDLDAEWLVLIPKNLSIPLYDSGTSGWYYTCYDGQWGYVYADYIR